MVHMLRSHGQPCGPLLRSFMGTCLADEAPQQLCVILAEADKVAQQAANALIHSDRPPARTGNARKR